MTDRKAIPVGLCREPPLLVVFLECGKQSEKEIPVMPQIIGMPQYNSTVVCRDLKFDRKPPELLRHKGHASGGRPAVG